MKFNRKIIVIDLETTGSVGRNYSIVQIGAVKLDEEFNVIDTFVSLAKPLEKDAELHAMNVHKIPIKDILRAKKLKVVLNEFEQWVGKPKEYYLAAWGTTFDITFLREQYLKLNRNYPFHYRCVDFKSIAMYELGKRNITFKYTGLKTLCKLMKIPFEGKPHDALSDATMTVKVVQRILKIGEKDGKTGK